MKNNSRTQAQRDPRVGLQKARPRAIERLRDSAAAVCTSVSYPSAPEAELWMQQQV